jgi:hypothetical protein
MTSLRRIAQLAVGAGMVAVLAGCAPTVSDDRGTQTPVPSRTGAPYSVTLDGVHISLLRQPDLAATPSAKATGYVSLPADDGSSDHVSLLVPATVCPTGVTTSALPTDFTTYLHELVPVGVTITSEDSISIDGVSGTEFTLATSSTLPGSLGQSRGAGCTDADSIGITTNESLRLAVFPVQNKDVLVWASTSAKSPTPGFFSSFQKMLQTVTFD